MHRYLLRGCHSSRPAHFFLAAIQDSTRSPLFRFLSNSAWCHLVRVSIDGPNWFVGAMGFLIVMNLIIQGTPYFALPKAFAKRISDPAKRNAEIETSTEDVRVTNGPNAALLPWKRFKYIWMYDQYIILAIRPPMQQFVILPTDGMTSDVRRDFEEARENRSIT